MRDHFWVEQHFYEGEKKFKLQNSNLKVLLLVALASSHFGFVEIVLLVVRDLFHHVVPLSRLLELGRVVIGSSGRPLLLLLLCQHGLKNRKS